MKVVLAGILLATAVSLVSCEARVVATRPVDVVYARPMSPGPDYVWVSGDWVWAGGSYRWHEGFWSPRRPGREWHPGFWQGQGRGYRWHKGGWR